MDCSDIWLSLDQDSKFIIAQYTGYKKFIDFLIRFRGLTTLDPSDMDLLAICARNSLKRKYENFILND